MGCTGAPPAPAVVSAPPVVAFLPVCTGMFLRSMWLVLGLGHTTAKMLRQRQNHELFHGN